MNYLKKKRKFHEIQVKEKEEDTKIQLTNYF